MAPPDSKKDGGEERDTREVWLEVSFQKGDCKNWWTANDEDDPLIIRHYSRFCPWLDVISFPRFISWDSKGLHFCNVVCKISNVFSFLRFFLKRNPFCEWFQMSNAHESSLTLCYYLVIWKRITAYRYRWTKTATTPSFVISIRYLRTKYISSWSYSNRTNRDGWEKRTTNSIQISFLLLSQHHFALFRDVTLTCHDVAFLNYIIGLFICEKEFLDLSTENTLGQIESSIPDRAFRQQQRDKWWTAAVPGPICRLAPGNTEWTRTLTTYHTASKLIS